MVLDGRGRRGFFKVFPQSSAHLLYFFQVLVGRQKLLALKLFLERSESVDAVRLEEGLEVGALRRLFARRLSSLFLETMRERQLGNVIQSDGGGTSRIVERENTHFYFVLFFCGVWTVLRWGKGCVRVRAQE